jgi:hypothetical protein
MKKKPNIIIIMTDQQRADLRKSEGFPCDTMPFLDSMALRGRTFPGPILPHPSVFPPGTASLQAGIPGH